MEISNLNNDLSNYINQTTKETSNQKEFEKLLDQAINKENEEEIKEACRQFESYFLNQLFNEMRKTIPESELFEASHGRKIYEDMLFQEYADEASKGTGIGLANMLYKQLSKNYIS